MTAKTLIGKDGYLFLSNDSSREIENHCIESCTIDIPHATLLSTYDNYLMVVFPDKSYVCREYLPDTYNTIYRPKFDRYASILNNKLLDGYSIIKDLPDVFYKTDTHMNLKGCLHILQASLIKLNQLFGYNITIEVPTTCKQVRSLTPLGVGIGDLTWPSNLGNQNLDSTDDIYYDTDAYTPFYKTMIDGSIHIVQYDLTDITCQYIGTTFTSDIISKHMLYKNNPNKHGKVLIFCDSFSLCILPLLVEFFREVYISKQLFTKSVVDRINPDHILEFRVERFLL